MIRPASASGISRFAFPANIFFIKKYPPLGCFFASLLYIDRRFANIIAESFSRIQVK